MWREAEASRPFPAALEERQGSGHDVFRVDPLPDIEHLVEPPRANRGWSHSNHQFRKRLDVANRGCSVAGQFLKSRSDVREIVFVAERAFELVDPADPRGETRRRKDRPPQAGVVEVTVGVNQAGQQHHVAKVLAG